MKQIIRICTVICIAVWGTLTVLISVKTSSLLFRPNTLFVLDAKQSYRPVDNTEKCREIVDFLKQIEPTVDLEFLCTDDWTSNDVMCAYFLRQNGFSNKDICRLPNDGRVVPKIVYYVVFSEDSLKPPEFLFMHYLSIVSVKRNLKPWAIYFVSDIMPDGYWWKRVQTDVEGVRFIYRKPPNLAGGNITFVHHKSDIVRLQILLSKCD